MQHLPDELILDIIAFLEPAELVSLSRVSRQFLHLSRDNKLWKQLCFAHSYAERRRRRLDITSPAPPAEADPRLAELVDAAHSLADALDVSVHDPRAPGAEAQLSRNRAKRRAALLSNWDPSGAAEDVNWYQEFVQRHAPPQLAWYQDAGPTADDDDDTLRREATGAALLYDAAGLASRLVAPLDDGSISIWDARASSSTVGKRLARSSPGLLTSRDGDLAHSQAAMTASGAVESVSIDSAQQKAYFAVQNALHEVDLATLQLVARTPYPFPLTALSEAHPTTPLTVATSHTLHLHDARSPPPPSATSLLTASTSFSALSTPPTTHACLSHPGPLSIAHIPDSLGDGNGNIWVAGRFPSLLNYDRRFFPRLRGAVYSGARLSSLSLLRTPFIPPALRLSHSPRALHAARSNPGLTLLAAGSYNGKGSLETYSLSPAPERALNSADAKSKHDGTACINRQTAAPAKLLCAVGQGVRIVVADAAGGVGWIERDARTPVRRVDVNELASASAPVGRGSERGGDIVQRLLPTASASLACAPSAGDEELVLWTGDGRLGQLGFGHGGVFDRDVFVDALEMQVDGDEADARALERDYGLEMRRALEQQASEVRWLRGYGL